MTNQYKIGDKVLVEAEFCGLRTKSGWEYINFPNNYEWDNVVVNPNLIRPYTPRQEFEYGEIVEVNGYGPEESEEWTMGKFVGKSQNQESEYPWYINEIENSGRLSLSVSSYRNIRKLQPQKPRETITIGGVDYYKDDVEKALKDLKPVEGK